MTVYTQAELMELVRQRFPYASITAPWDARYARLSRKHILGEFSQELVDVMFYLRGSAKWAASYDCDKFADFARALLRMKHNLAQGANKDAPEGVACGMIAYAVGGDRSKAHCINVIATENGVECWEPQTQKFVQLSVDEINSTWLVQF